MLKFLLGLLAIGFAVITPTESFATTAESGYWARADNSVMYRRRHGADDGDADDQPGGAHAEEDERDHDERYEDESHHNESHRGGLNAAGHRGVVAGNTRNNKNKPASETIGR